MVVIPFKKVPEGASQELRKAMYEQWLAAFKRANPRYFWWQALREESRQ